MKPIKPRVWLLGGPLFVILVLAGTLAILADTPHCCQTLTNNNPPVALENVAEAWVAIFPWALLAGGVAGWYIVIDKINERRRKKEDS